ncbi:hypothetical protein CRE_22474 [Caenorhabditis remanei]|uniref:Uncharacterized protein n=1 Tax=Caenorhabditis remanei TaxID=31234 RepID=E3MDV3_CAERE|nr:hypothetical protein CRE_22474 [Caenorhabditis remanei]
MIQRGAARTTDTTTVEPTAVRGQRGDSGGTQGGAEVYNNRPTSARRNSLLCEECARRIDSICLIVIAVPAPYFLVVVQYVTT